MKFSWNAVKAGVGLFLAFGISLGILIFIIISSADPDEDFSFELLAGMFGFLVAMIASPNLATIVGAIISKDFDEESDAAFNGGIAGVAGTFLMVFIAVLFLVAALAVLEEDSDSSSDDSSSDDSSSDDDSEGDFGELISFAVKGLLPSGVGGAIGAFGGFRFLWSKMPSSEMMTSRSVSAQPVVAQPVIAQPVVAQAVVSESATISCPNCNSEMTVQRLGKLQSVNCQNCGTTGEIEI